MTGIAANNDSKPAALIVGGSSGIGLATARLLAARGHPLAIVARDRAKLTRAAQELRAVGAPRVDEWPCDLQSDDAVDALIATRLAASNDTARFARLVLCAGVFTPKPFVEHTRADYRQYAALTESQYFITQAVVRGWLAAIGSESADHAIKRSIVFIGSMWARQAIELTPASAYACAKSGLHALTAQLAMELAPHGIRVNCVVPAGVRTDAFFAAVPEGERAAVGKLFDKFHPLGRMGAAEEVAHAVDFLLDGQKAAWTTGALLDVDGGVMAGRNIY